MQGQGLSGEGMAGQAQARQGRAGQNRAGRGSMGQCRSGQGQKGLCWAGLWWTVHNRAVARRVVRHWKQGQAQARTTRQGRLEGQAQQGWAHLVQTVAQPQPGYPSDNS